MEYLDLPIFKKTYDLYKSFYGYRQSIPKQDRYTIWQTSEHTLLEIIEGLLRASQLSKHDKLQTLETVSVKLNFLRVTVRLMKDTKTIDTKKYITIEESLDEIGRMLGGWLRSIKQ